MEDCFDSDSCKEYLEITWVDNEFNNTASLKDLTFTCGYDYDLNDQIIILILDFDRLKVSVEQTDDKNFKILYDNKPFFISIKAFWALIKKGKNLTKKNISKLRIHLLHWNSGMFLAVLKHTFVKKHNC